MKSRSAAIERVVDFAGQDGSAADAGHLQNGVLRSPAPPGPVDETLQLRANEPRHAGLGPKGVMPELLVQFIAQGYGDSPHSSSELLNRIEVRDQV